jgi:hypothetical protein
MPVAVDYDASDQLLQKCWLDIPKSAAGSYVEGWRLEILSPVQNSKEACSAKNPTKPNHVIVGILSEGRWTATTMASTVTTTLRVR